MNVSKVFSAFQRSAAILGLGLSAFVFAAPQEASAQQRTASEARCEQLVQGKVAWNRQGNRGWNAANLRAFCAGVGDYNARIKCFRQQVSNGIGWQQAVPLCKLHTSAAFSPESQCFNAFQGKIAWDRTNGNKRWHPGNLRRLCAGVVHVDKRTGCFRQMIRIGRGFQKAFQKCKTIGGANATAGFRILDENRQPGGTISKNTQAKSWLKTAAKGWMSHLPNSTNLGNISIPGTHDSGARHGVIGCPTQTWSITEQLNAGIRYLDIRNRRTKNGFAIHHGRCFQHMMFGNVMNEVSNFLRRNPTETILMRVKEEHTPQSGAPSFSDIWAGYQQRYGSIFAREFTDSSGNVRIPTLGEVRGKVFVIRNSSGIPRMGAGFADNRILARMDRYNIVRGGDVNCPRVDCTKASMNEKKKFVKSFIDFAGRTPKLILNHLSGTGGAAIVTGGWTPEGVAKQVHPVAYNHIGAYRGSKKETGVLIMDFPGERLIYRIIRTNFTN